MKLTWRIKLDNTSSYIDVRHTYDEDQSFEENMGDSMVEAGTRMIDRLMHELDNAFPESEVAKTKLGLIVVCELIAYEDNENEAPIVAKDVQRYYGFLYTPLLAANGGHHTTDALLCTLNELTDILDESAKNSLERLKNKGFVLFSGDYSD